MTNTYGVDIRVTEEQRQTFNDIFAPAMSILVERLGYYADYEYPDGKVSMTIRGPFSDVMEYIKHMAREKAA